MTDDSKNIFLNAALHYALVNNWRVLPCAVRGKKPLTRNGCSDATTDEAQIRAWWAEFPNANVGIATGRESGLAVADVDSHKGADSEALLVGGLGEEIFNTVGVKTGGGGLQFYYNFPNFDLRNSASQLGKFIDVRGEGGYVIAPPSVHESGRSYELLAESDESAGLMDFPFQWIEKLQSLKNQPSVLSVKSSNGSPAANGTGGNNGFATTAAVSVPADGFYVPAPYQVQKLPEEIVFGTRHDQLFKIACGLRSKGLPFEAIDAALQQINLKIVVPPGPAANVRKIAQSAMRYDADRELQTISEETVQNWDDVSIARLFREEYREKIRFNVDAKKWLIWTGSHWRNDSKGAVEMEAQKFSQNLYVRVPAMITSQSDMAAAQRQIRRSNTKAGLQAFLDLACPHLAVSSAELDNDNYLLNCKNGTVNLRTGKVSAHNPADLITKCIPYDYDPSAVCPTFDTFLNTIQPDAAIRGFLQQSIGYSLLGIVRERVFWIMYGSGNNGKSVFINLFSKILADYASSTTSASIMSKKNDSIPNDIARLQGRRFIVVPETEENERISASLIKQLTGGDKITARFLFAEFFDFYFSGKLWIATNHKPTITDHSKGFWDRLKIIPFTVDIPKEKIIKQDTLINSLLAEASGILNWALRGAAQYFAADALKVPASIQKEIDDYKYEQDSIAQFIDEACLVGEDYEVENPLLYGRYVNFCKDNGEYARSHRRLTQTLKERGFVQGHQKTRTWVGIMLR